MVRSHAFRLGILVSDFCGLRSIVWVKSICGLFRCRFGFDESHPNLEDIGSCCVSGVGNLIGDRLPFVRCGTAIVVAEGEGGVLGVNFLFLWVAVFPIGIPGAGHVVGLLIPVVMMA